MMPACSRRRMRSATLVDDRPMLLPISANESRAFF
jgi:hypothetical protein